MKTDILTVAFAIFCAGVLASSVTASGIFDSEEQPPSALQQGVALK